LEGGAKVFVGCKPAEIAEARPVAAVFLGCVKDVVTFSPKEAGAIVIVSVASGELGLASPAMCVGSVIVGFTGATTGGVAGVAGTAAGA